MSLDITQPDQIGEINKYNFRTETHGVFKARKGIDREIVGQISEIKQEPAWMRDFRLQSLEIFESKRCRLGAVICRSISRTSITT